MADLLRAELTRVFERKLSNPEFAGLVVTEVRMSDDLGVAWIAVRRLADDPDSARRRALLEALGRASAKLRRLVGPKLRLRRVPELRFGYDLGHDAMRRVQQLLDEIALESSAGKKSSAG